MMVLACCLFFLLMKKTICNKLIRDNIPEIIEKSGKECDVKVLDDEEYIHKLKEKIIEEVMKYMKLIKKILWENWPMCWK